MNFQTAFTLIREIFPADCQSLSDFWIHQAKKSDRPEVAVDAAREVWADVSGFYDYVKGETAAWGSNPIHWDTSVIAEQLATGFISLDEAKAEFRAKLIGYFDSLV